MKRIILTLAGAAALMFPAAAFASVDTNLAHSVNVVEANGGAKWVHIIGTHTAYSGTFTAQMCSSTFNGGGVTTFLAHPIIFTFGTSGYTRNGNYVTMGSATFGSAC